MKGSGVNIDFKIDPRSMAELHEILSQFPDKMRSKVLRGALRRTLKQQMKATVSMARPQDVRTRRDVAIKTKTYKRGKVIWASVGVNWDVGGTRRDSKYQGWRAHFHDVGYRAWRKGMRANAMRPDEPRGPKRPSRNPNPRFAPFIRFNKGWRKGKKGINLGGGVWHNTGYLSIPARMFEPKILSSVKNEIMNSVEETSG